MVSSSLNLLKDGLPKWARLVCDGDGFFEAMVAPRRPSGSPGRNYRLHFQARRDGGADVKEAADSPLLPNFCMERHINPGGTFCVFFGSTRPLSDEFEATKWWENLNKYLISQDYAHSRREWRLKEGLSHGDAALTQLEMEKIAAPLGWEDELHYAMFRRKGWLSGPLPRLNKTKTALVNARTACPRGCRHLHGLNRRSKCTQSKCASGCKKQHKPVVRVNCPNRQAVEALVLLEHRRRAQELKIAKDVQNEDFVCCGTMDHCLLQDVEAGLMV